MNDTLAQKAILAALQCEWEKALQINLELEAQNPNNVDVLNRISKAYYELGKPKKAVQYCKKALKIDSINPIALKCIDKYVSASIHSGALDNQTSKPRRDQEFFIEEPGKTKTVVLINLGDASVILGLSCGDNVALVAGRHRVSVSTELGKHVGRFPDDMASRLLALMEDGYEYEVFVKSATVTRVKVFVRERKRAREDRPSFPYRSA